MTDFLRLDLLEHLGKYGADDAREGCAQLGVAEIELGALLRGLQRPDLGQGLLGRRVAVLEAGPGDDALVEQLLVAIELAGRIGVGGLGALQVGEGTVELGLVGCGIEDREDVAFLDLVAGLDATLLDAPGDAEGEHRLARRTRLSWDGPPRNQVGVDHPEDFDRPRRVGLGGCPVGNQQDRQRRNGNHA